MRLVGILALLILSVGFVVAESKDDSKDKVTLKDGQVITGTVLSESDSGVEVLDGKEKIKVPMWAVEKIERNGKVSAAGSGATTTPALSAWIDLCVKNLASDDEGVRTGAGAALHAAGPAAVPALQKAANGSDPTLAERAQKLISSPRPPARTRQARRANAGSLTPEEHRERTLKRTKDLNLKPEQEGDVHQIFMEYREQTLAVSKTVVDGDVSREEAQKSFAALRDQLNSKLSAVLSEEQMKKHLASTERAPRR